MSKYIVTLSEPKTTECLDILINKRVKIIYNNMYYIGVLIEYDISKPIKPSLYAYSEPEYVGKFPERKDLLVDILSFVTNPADENAKINYIIKAEDSVGTIYACEKPENDGIMQILNGTFPVRSKIEVLPADNPNRKTIGFKIKEKIGIGVINTKALSRLEVSRQNPSDCDMSQNTKKPYNEDDIICYRIMTHKGCTQNFFIKYYDCISIEILSDNPNDFGTAK